jgi:hypothetical protein
MLGDPSTVDQQSAGQADQPQSNVALILDASGSMNEDLPGEGQTKLAVAKEVLAEVIPQIPTELNGTLWIYGHRHSGDPKSESCKDIEQVYPLGPVDAQAYVNTVRGITAQGWTPISDSIQKAAENLPAGDFNSVILVSDGEETCGGNPCALAEALKKSDAELTVHVVGYAVGAVTQEQLQCIAAVSGGSYHDATDAEGLLQALEDALAATVVETTLRVEIALPDGTEVGGDVWLYEAGTDRAVSVYRAWTDNLVPPGRYDLFIDTLPDLLYRDLELPEGSTTIVRVIQGAIAVLTPEREYIAGDFYEASTDTRLGAYGHEGPVALSPGTYYVQVTNSTSAPVPLEAGQLVEMVMGTISVKSPDGDLVAADFYDAATDQRLGSWGFDGPVALLPGTYYVQANKSTSAPITLSSGAAEELMLGSITVWSPDGQFVAADFYQAPDGKRLGSYGYDGAVLLVPGSYYLGVNGSTSEPIALAAGAEEEVRLGAIQVDGSFEIWAADGKRLGNYSDMLLLVPGTYSVELEDGTKIENVTVEPGQVTAVD